MWAVLSESFGPIKTLLGNLPPGRAEAFKSEMLEFFRSEAKDGGVSLDRAYLLIHGVRKS